MPPRQPADPDIAKIILGFTDQLSKVSTGVGELTGQARELIHQVNNMSMELKAIGTRVLKLEQAEQRREGAYSFAVSIRQWAPAVVAVVFATIAFLKMSGKI